MIIFKTNTFADVILLKDYNIKMSTMKKPVNIATGNDILLSILYRAFTTATSVENRLHEFSLNK